MEIDGDATVEVELFDADGNVFSQESLPLSFHAKLDRANRIHEFTELRVDTSALTGEPTVSSVPQPGDT